MSRIAKLKFLDSEKTEIERKFDEAINSSMIERYSSEND